MIITKSPLRITLGGGGTDLPFYAEKHGGFVISMAINRYVYTALHPSFDGRIHLKYIDEYESVIRPSALSNFTARRIMSHFNARNVEVYSTSDIPAQTGLGSSGSFVVSLIQLMQKQYPDQDLITQNDDILDLAYKVESAMGYGIQDPAVSLLGGIVIIDIDEGYDYRAQRSDLNGVHEDLKESMMFFYTGLRRPPFRVFASQKKEAKIDHFDKIKDIGFDIWEALRKREISRFGELTYQHWKEECCTSPEISNNRLNDLVGRTMKLGADGAKISSAGGGYLTVIATKEKTRQNIRDNLGALLNEEKFEISHTGCGIIHEG